MRMRSLREERGVSAVIVSVSLIAIFGASMLAIDAGSVWATRRAIVTGTDAASLGAARLYAAGLQDPCTAAGVSAGESEGSAILAANDSRSEHTGLTNPYEVTVTDCTTTGLRTGHVRYDGRLAAQQAFSGIFGFGKTKPFSSSTAEFGWVVEIAEGLRPFTVCDQHTPWNPNDPAPNPLPSATGAGPFAHFALWNWKEKGQITQAQYDAYYATNPTQYPSMATNGINANVVYQSPAQGGGVVHRIDLKDNCGGGAAWRGWVDYESEANSTDTLRDWLRTGYPGSVALTPHDCATHEAGDPDDCDAFPGSHNGLEPALDDITCPAATDSADCFVFPIILNGGVVGNGAGGIDINQTGFLYVILRGFGANGQNNPCQGNNDCLLDLEFVRVQGEGEIGGNPSGGITTPRGTSLCGIDHDSTSNRCSV